MEMEKMISLFFLQGFKIQTHTRAYIHHLLKSKELLADVLLHAHNQHQVLILFRRARACLDRSEAKSGLRGTHDHSEAFHKWIETIKATYIID